MQGVDDTGLTPDIAQLIIDATPHAVVAIDADQRIRLFNPGAEHAFGYSAEEVIDEPLDLLIPENLVAAHCGHVNGFAAAGGRPQWMKDRDPIQGRRRDGSHFPADASITTIEHGGERLFAAVLTDRSEISAMQTEIRRLAQAVEQSADMVWITDAMGRIEYVNPAFEQVTGYVRDEAMGRTTGELLGAGERNDRFYAGLWAKLRRGESFRGVFANVASDGRRLQIDETISPVRDADGNTGYFIATGRDVTERHRLESELRRMAHHDAVTGLHNRQYFDKQLHLALREARDRDRGLALILIDLDRFKDINDALGHSAGDQALRFAARCAVASVREHDLVARHGGDELVMLVRGVASFEEVQPIAERLMLRLREPMAVEGDRSIELAASVGIALYPEAGDSGEELLRAADAAMYRAKHAGGRRYAVHSHDLDHHAAERWDLIRALDNARWNDEFSLQYQPISASDSQTLTGIEALLRWHHPEHGMVGPDEFVPLAEETRQIRELGHWVIETACRQVASWRAAGLETPPAFVNLSAVQLQDPDFRDQVMTTLAAAGLPASGLVLEITENTLLSAHHGVTRSLAELRESGVRIALDDFGTGYCSLGYLKRFPVDFIKIDREFVRGVAHDRGSRAIVESVITFGQVFNCDVIAEGIETADEATTLTGMGIGMLQGYLIGAPAWPDELARDWFIARGSAHA